MDSKKQTKTFDLLNWQINSKHLGFQGGTSALFPLPPCFGIIHFIVNSARHTYQTLNNTITTHTRQTNNNT